MKLESPSRCCAGRVDNPVCDSSRLTSSTPCGSAPVPELIRLFERAHFDVNSLLSYWQNLHCPCPALPCTDLCSVDSFITLRPAPLLPLNSYLKKLEIAEEESKTRGGPCPAGGRIMSLECDVHSQGCARVDVTLPPAHLLPSSTGKTSDCSVCTGDGAGGVGVAEQGPDAADSYVY